MVLFDFFSNFSKYVGSVENFPFDFYALISRDYYYFDFRGVLKKYSSSYVVGVGCNDLLMISVTGGILSFEGVV